MKLFKTIAVMISMMTAYVQGYEVLDTNYVEYIEKEILVYSNNVKVDHDKYEETLKKIELIENVDTSVYYSRTLNKANTAKVVREMENNGKYYGSSKFSSAKHAYQITKPTLRFILRMAHKKGQLKHINLKNWSVRKNQDSLFHFYMNYNRKISEPHLPTSNIITDYLVWQTGAGKNGLRNYIRIVNGETELKTKKINVLRNNMRKVDYAKYERYNYNKALTLIHELDLQVDKAYIPSYRKRMTYNEMRVFLYKFIPELKDIILNESKTTLVKIWLNANICKIKRVVDKVV